MTIRPHTIFPSFFFQTVVVCVHGGGFIRISALVLLRSCMALVVLITCYEYLGRLDQWTMNPSI